MGKDELRLAKSAAHEEGLSLSAYVTRAVRERLQERRRLEAARAFLATFLPDEFPTPDEQRALVELWTRPREGKSPPQVGPARRRRSAAT
jgi:hypothetical protein